MLDELQRKAGAVSAITRERFDAGGRTTANNMASGRYTTNLNMCLYRRTTAESDRVSKSLDAQHASAETRDTVLSELRQRHEGYRERSSRVGAALDGRRVKANAAIAAQTQRSETRLGQ